MSKNVVLPQSFYRRSAQDVAPELLGKYLVLKKRGGAKGYAITEVEIYDGENDEACHAHKGKTKRTAVMYEGGGVWYVYLCYGIHFMLNIVVGGAGHPAAVLIRGTAEYGGPGKLTKALAVDKRFNAKKATRETGLWIEDRGAVVLKGDIEQLPRVGIDYAGEPWRSKKWRLKWTK